MEQIYKTVDKDQDGKLSKEEYFAIWKDKTTAEKNFRWYDKDGDGYITKEEFYAPLRKIEKEMGKRK